MTSTELLKAAASIMIGPSARRCRSYIRVMVYARQRNLLWLARVLSRRLQAYGLYISHEADISLTVKFPHPTSIVIGRGVVIHEDVTIYQGVTIGGRRSGDWRERNYPEVKAGATLFAGAVIAGKVKIGKNSVVGANSVVISDIPDGAVCVGAPARIVRQRIDGKNEK